jgi:ankyrin repeat protein
MAIYAAQLWTDHAPLAQTSEDTVRAIVRFLETQATFQRWVALYLPDRFPTPSSLCSLGSNLYYACFFGLIFPARDLLSNGADVNLQGGYYGNPLQAASEKGHQEVVQLLLNKGASVNAPGGFYGNALQAASSRGYQKVVQLLLDKGADVNAQGGHYGNALQAASEKGHQEVVRLLLKKGASVNKDRHVYASTLYTASERGYQGIVQLLQRRYPITSFSK